MSNRKKRRAFSADQKSKAVIEHLQDKKPVSKICDELGIHPNQFYDWQKQALGNLASAFERSSGIKERTHQKEMEKVKIKLIQKDEVIAELLTEHLSLKKNLGEI